MRHLDGCTATCRLLFTTLMVFAWSGGLTALAAPAGAAELSDPAELIRAIEAAERNLPRDTFDPAAVVRQVGREPEKLFEWVRDNTHWVPYAGCLRGPVGVLMDRLGSNLDRAVLLGELLRAAGATKVRLARGTLSEEQAKRLAAAARPASQEAPAGATAQAAGQAAGQAAPTDAATTAPAELQRLSADVNRQSASLAETLKAAIDAPRAAPGAAAGGQADEAWKALADHWWVQYDAGGRTVDLDPAAPDARPGARNAEATRTHDLPDFSDPGTGMPGAAPAVNALPPEVWHEVTVRVVVEQAKDGKPKEAVALTRTLRPALLHGHRVVLHHFPLSPPPQAPAGPASTDVKTSLQRYKATVLATREWYPMLEVGARLTGDASVTDAGDLNPNPQVDAIKGTGKSVGKTFADAFDVLSADPPAAAAPPPASGGAFSAAWVEYEVKPVGRAATKVRRQVFDLLGPAARAAGSAATLAAPSEEQRLDRGLALGGRTSLLVLGAQPSPQFVQHVMLAGIKAHADLLPEVSRPADQPMRTPPAQPLTDRLNKISPPHGPLYGVALARHLWSPHRGRVYLDRPNVLSHHAFVRRADKTGELMACEAIDIAANALAVRPVTGGAGAGTAAASTGDERRVLTEQGVFDTVAETAFGGGCGTSESAAGVLAAAKEKGVKWLTLRGAQDPALKALDLPPDDRARVARELEEGMTVVIPERPVQVQEHGADPTTAVAYWRIDPATGTALGIGRNGWGPNMVERGSLAYYLISGSEAVKEIRFLACAIAVAAMACSLACVAGGDLASAEAFFAVAKAATKGCK